MEEMQQVQFALPSPARIFTPAVTVVLILSVAGLLLLIYANDFSRDFLALGPENFIHGRFWQILTYPFLNCPLSLVFNGLIILFIGSDIEREWKTGSFVLLWLITSVCCGLVWVIIGLLIGNNYTGAGSASCTFGIITAMGLMRRDKRFFVFFATIEGQYLAMVLIAAGIILSVFPPINLIWVLGVPVSYLYIKMRWKMASRVRIGLADRGQRRSGSFVDID
jgi:membrane associated rhomboid family serine protease